MERWNLDWLPEKQLERADDGCTQSWITTEGCPQRVNAGEDDSLVPSSSLSRSRQGSFDASYHESAGRIVRFPTTLPKILLDNVFRTLIPAKRSVLNFEALVTFGSSGKEAREIGSQ